MALLRNFLTGTQADVDAQLAEIAQLSHASADSPLWEAINAPFMDHRGGYAAWSATYDVAPNSVISLDDRTVLPLLAKLPGGRALDAACGTGRHARYLQRLGHQVVGVDVSLEMLDLARRKVTEAQFVIGGLEQLPFRTASFDLGVCALSLTHCEDLSAAIRELARVVRLGGRLILSDVHPFPILALSGHVAIFRDAEGSRAFVRNFAHLHSAYLSAFDSAGLAVRGCIEPTYTEIETTMMLPSGVYPETARNALIGIPWLLVWDLERR
jgi:SAM-dependent methyltransferase